MAYVHGWGCLPTRFDVPLGQLPACTQQLTFSHQLHGRGIRLRLSNRYGLEPLQIDGIFIQCVDGTGQVTGEGVCTTEGESRKHLIPGEVILTDPLALTITPTDQVVVRMIFEAPQTIYSLCQTWSRDSWTVNFTSDGQVSRTRDLLQVLQFDENDHDGAVGIEEVLLDSPVPVEEVAMFGDSITHMAFYTDALIARFRKIAPGRLTFRNLGIGGNRLLHEASYVPQIPSEGKLFGPKGLERFEQDVYGLGHQPAWVSVLIGINDFTHPYALDHLEEEVTLEAYQEAMTTLAGIAHRRGSKILFGTLMPFNDGQKAYFNQTEALRLGANQWIRSQGISDGIIDFDIATRQQGAPDWMVSTFHMGDGLHPNHEGGKAMASIFPLQVFIDRERGQ